MSVPYPVPEADDHARDRAQPDAAPADRVEADPAPAVPAEPVRVDLLVIAALRLEQAALRRGLNDVPVLRCGMGAAGVDQMAARPEFGNAFAAGPPAAVIAGVGGAVDLTLQPGDLVVATEIRDEHGSIRTAGAAPLVAELRALGYRVRSGPVYSSATIVHGAERGRLARSGAIAVDMESGPVARALMAAGEPVLAVVRVIVDTPHRPLLHAGTAPAGVRALLALTRIGPAIRRWSGTLGPRSILLAAPRSFCAGVERAIDIVERALVRYPAPVYVRRQIVHNAHVVADLEQRGAIFVEELDQVPDRATVILSAHGVAPAVRDEALRRNMQVIDATCPLVAKVHTETRRFLNRGDSVILIGHERHDETEGTMGEGPGRIALVADVEAARTVEVPDPRRVAFVTQTTLASDEVYEVAATLRQRFPGIAEPPSDDICFATTNRQNAIRAIASRSDVVLVVGSQNSSNAHRLVEVAERCGSVAHLIEDATAIRPHWLVGARSVGLSASASAPPHLVADVVATLRALGPVEVSEERVADEEVTFSLPKEVDN